MSVSRCFGIEELLFGGARFFMTAMLVLLLCFFAFERFRSLGDFIVRVTLCFGRVEFLFKIILSDLFVAE
jgi:hypothetical protein